MSTRGCIAIKNGNSWFGVYNHSDSYPSYLGLGLWQDWQDGKLTADFIKAHPDGFSLYPKVCYCHDPYFSERDGSSAKDSPHYNGKEPEWLTPETADPLFIEWVYVFDMEGGTMEVLAGVPIGGETAEYRYTQVALLDKEDPEPTWLEDVEEHV